MDKQINTISFCPDNYIEYYESLGKKSVNDQQMYEDIQSFIRIALKNKYQMKVCTDGYCTIIEYEHEDQNLSGLRLEWIGDEDDYEIDGEVESE